MSMAGYSLELRIQNVLDKAGVRRLNVEVSLTNLSAVGKIAARLDKTRTDENLSRFRKFLGGDRSFLHELPAWYNAETLDDAENSLTGIIDLGRILHISTLIRNPKEDKNPEGPGRPACWVRGVCLLRSLR